MGVSKTNYFFQLKYQFTWWNLLSRKSLSDETSAGGGGAAVWWWRWPAIQWWPDSLIMTGNHHNPTRRTQVQQKCGKVRYFFSLNYNRLNKPHKKKSINSMIEISDSPHVLTGKKNLHIKKDELKNTCLEKEKPMCGTHLHYRNIGHELTYAPLVCHTEHLEAPWGGGWQRRHVP